MVHADDLLGDVRRLRERAEAILLKAERARDWRAATGAIREARGCVELLLRLLGELSDERIEVRIAEGVEREAEAALDRLRAVLDPAAYRLALEALAVGEGHDRHHEN